MRGLVLDFADASIEVSSSKNERSMNPRTLLVPTLILKGIEKIAIRVSEDKVLNLSTCKSLLRYELAFQ
jgi:hypothetical protein